MISIIVCSVAYDTFKTFAQNVSETIGVPFEMIRIDNSGNQYSICSAYNEGASKAKFEFICFAHEDIYIRTQDWGKKVIEIFTANRKLGLLGIAGSKYRTLTPCSWGSYSESNYINVIQHFKYSKGKAEHWMYNPTNESLPRVVCVDGAWLCTKKHIVLNTPFDQGTFKGFHCYDIDFSLSVLQKNEVAVVFDILIEHFSDGGYTKTWIEETLKLHEKWKDQLPVNLSGISRKEQQQKEKEAALLFLNIMHNNNLPPSGMRKLIHFTIRQFNLGLKNELSLYFSVFKETIKYYTGLKNFRN